MPTAAAAFKNSASFRRAAGLAVLVAIHLAALALLLRYEDEWVAELAYVLFWGVLNGFWLFLLRRPTPAAALSLAMLVLLIQLSLFKHSVLLMTVTFTDLMVVDSDTISFLLTIWPDLQGKLIAGAAIGVPVLVLIWWLDSLRVRRLLALAFFGFCFAALAALSFAQPLDREDEFSGRHFVSKFARSGAVALVDIARRGVLEADAASSSRLDLAAMDECPGPALLPPAQAGEEGRGPLPHIIMIFDELSFDISAIPGIEVPPDYQKRFGSIDGKQRHFLVEGAGGPSWFTEYNVLTGLSVRSYGRFAEAVTRLANGRVLRGLPNALRRCGYHTATIYPYLGGFLGARSFQTTAGIENFIDAKELGSRDRQTDGFYFDFALRALASEHGPEPMFIFVYTSANHFPWDFRYRADRVPGWRPTSNRTDVDEYLRRQEISARDYAQFVERLRQDFPNDKFLIVRFGDHQPMFAKYLVDPTLDEAALAQRIDHFDPRYFTTYYAIDAINFTPVDLSSAVDPLDAPYLPLVVLEAAGVPLDASFAEQKQILQRCSGLFYLCNGGAEARRFNRLLIDAGLIKGL